MPGRDLSADLFGDVPAAQKGGRDLSSDLFPPAAAAKPAGALDRVQAAGAGVNKGVFSDLAGIPVDAIANVLDLGKAAIGYTTSKITGHAPPEWTEPMDRSKVAGTSDWIAQKIGQGANAVGMQSPVAPARPDDAVSRILFSGGRGLGTSISPDPRAKLSAGMQVTNALMGGLSGLSSGAVGEVAPEWAGLAGMLPQAGVNAGAAATKYLVRGGEAGRQAMDQRMQDLRAGGIDSPSVGLASGNKFVSGLENLLSHTPGSMGLYDQAQAANVAGMQAKTEGIRDAISPEYGPVVAGHAIQADLKGAFQQRTKATAKALAERVASLVGRDTVVPVDNTLDASARLSAPIPGAEATSAAFIQPRIASLANNLRTDVYGAMPASARPLSGNPTLNAALTPETPQVAVNNSGLWNIPVAPNNPLPQASTLPVRRAPVVMDSLTNMPRPSEQLSPLPQRTGPNGTLNLPLSQRVEQEVVANPSLWNLPTAPHEPMAQRAQSIGRQDIPNATLWNLQKETGIPFSALKKLRSSIGEETQSNAIMGTPEQAQFKQLYGALSDDMRNAAGTADRGRAGVAVGPLQMADQPATIAMNRANQHFSTAMSRAEELNGIANRDTPEGAYGAVASSLKSGPTIYERLRSAITPEARQKVVATVVNDMGAAAPGQQNADGSTWSPRSFLSNYNRLNGDARDALFTRLPGGQTYADNLSKVAKAAEMMGDSSKVWSNPSGTSHALAARGAVGTIGLGVVGGLFYTPLLAPAGVAGGTMLASHQISQRLLLNPKFVNWLAKAPNVPADQQQAYMQRLMATAAITKDPQFQQDASAYLQSVQGGQQQ